MAPGSPAGEFIEEWKVGRVELLSSVEQLQETGRVFDYERLQQFNKLDQAKRLMESGVAVAEVVAEVSCLLWNARRSWMIIGCLPVIAGKIDDVCRDSPNGQVGELRKARVVGELCNMQRQKGSWSQSWIPSSIHELSGREVDIGERWTVF